MIGSPSAIIHKEKGVIEVLPNPDETHIAVTS